MAQDGATAGGCRGGRDEPARTLGDRPRPCSRGAGTRSARKVGETREASVIRGSAGIFTVAVVVAAAVFLADRPGRVDIIWQGWQIETSVGVLVAAAVLAALVVWLLVSMLWLIISSPRRMLRSRRARQRRAGYRALAQGMVAVAAGDAQDAQRLARRSDVLLAYPPLTLLLSAQAAQLDGDEGAAKRFFTAMLERRETEFLGLRGLLNQALREGDRGA